jgi:hypothetical protein
MPVKPKRSRRAQRMDLDLEMELVEGWHLDSIAAWAKDREILRECWFQYRDVLVERWGPVEKLAGWANFEATPRQRAAFRWDECPSPGAAVRDGIATVSEPANLALQRHRRGNVIPISEVKR